MSWIDVSREKKPALLFARWDGGGWTRPRTISKDPDLLVNWADFPSIVALEDGTLAAHWPAKSRGGRWQDYDIRVSTSSDGGRSWSAPFSPHRDGTRSEHGFVSLVPATGGRFWAAWLDGRLTAAAGGAQALYFAEYDGRGFGPESPLDSRVCDCCQTAAAETPAGPLIAYRDRSDKEVRDISYVRRRADAWTRPRTLHADDWKIHGCPVNGPALAAAGGAVAVAWFTAAGIEGRVSVAFSADDGATFGAPIRLDGGHPLGRLDLASLEDGSAVVCWLEIGESGTELLLRRVSADGKLGRPLSLGLSSESRASGFPSLVRFGDTLLAAWTDTGRGPARVRLARVDPGKAWP